MDKKTLIVYGIVLLTIQVLVMLPIFVTYPSMTAYAASKDSIELITDSLNRIEEKIDKLIIGY